MSAPNLQEIDWAINELKAQESSKYGYILLAALYICRKEMQGGAVSTPQIAAYSEANEPGQEVVEEYGDSEFLRAVAGKDPAAVWAVMDAHMETLKLVKPRAYEGVMRKLDSL